MTIKKRLSVICLTFGIIPLLILYWLGGTWGLMANHAFQHVVALGFMSAILLGLFSSSVVRHWLFGKQLKKIQNFCLAVKDGSYDVFLPVPNESNDVEDENEMVELMRNMNWMAHHIKLNEENLQKTVHDLEKSQKKIQAQKDELEKVYDEQLIVQKELEARTNQLTEVVNKIRNLLDHAGQGFVSFGKDLIVAEEYSAECVMIFNREIAGEEAAKLLYPEDKEQEKFIKSVFQKIFSVKDDFLQETYFSLLPREIIVDKNYIQIDYKFINYPGKEDYKEIMLVLTDVTKEKQMQKQIQEEKEILSMVVKVINQYDDFVAAVQGYTNFCQKELANILEAACPAGEKVSTLFSVVHTWKGTFAQLNMQYIVKELHELEGALAKMREQGKHEITVLQECLRFYTPLRMSNWLTHELDILKRIVGKQFLLQHDMINIEKSRLEYLKNKVGQWPDSLQKQEILSGLEYLRYKPFHELLQVYPEYTVSLAKRYEKEIHTFTITGGDILVNPAIYHNVTQTFVHIFRNAVAHGLETMEERIEAGKEEQGKISCDIQTTSENIVVTVKDDGRGIDGNRMRELAIDKGLLDKNAAISLSDEDAQQLIFADGLSSTICADEIAGRGVGLYAVRKEIEKLGGQIAVSSKKGSGTEFRLVLPLQAS